MITGLKDKASLRREYLQVRDAIPQADRVRLSRQILETVTGSADYLEAETILIYYAIGSEVQTRELILDALGRGKTVALPKILGKHRMDFFPVADLSRLCRGVWGIPEPSGEGQAPCRSGLMLMPGVAFDTSLGRVGYGGGYYDCFLEQYGDRIRSLALAYDQQILEGEVIPMESSDRKPSRIVTPSRLITTVGIRSFT